MILRSLCATGAAACAVSAWIVAPWSTTAVRELAGAFTRPVLLPFAWQALGTAQQSGDEAEYLARARQITDLLPSWTDGHLVFAYRLALGGDGAAPDGDGRDAQRRLQLALAWLDGARADAGRREVDLLLTMAFLPEVAALQQPALAERLRPHGGAAAIADRYLAEAERLRDGPEVRERRTFLAPKLVAALLAADQPAEALAVLDTAIARSADVRDRELAAEWRQRLEEVRRRLRGDPTVDLGAVRDDPRFEPLLPHLR